MQLNSPVIADTSVFIDFFREVSAKNKFMREGLIEGVIVLSPFVRLELLFGVRKSERKSLRDLLDGLHCPIPTSDFYSTAEELLPLPKQRGINPGLIDYLIVVQALISGYALFTRDKVMKSIARTLDVQLIAGN